MGPCAGCVLSHINDIGHAHRDAVSRVTRWLLGRRAEADAVNARVDGPVRRSWCDSNAAHSSMPSAACVITLMTSTVLAMSGMSRSAVARMRAPEGLPSASKVSSFSLDSSGACARSCGVCGNDAAARVARLRRTTSSICTDVSATHPARGQAGGHMRAFSAGSVWEPHLVEIVE